VVEQGRRNSRGRAAAGGPGECLINHSDRQSYERPGDEIYPQGTSVCNSAIAVIVSSAGDEVKEEVTFINVVVFGKQADTCGQYLNKGAPC